MMSRVHINLIANFLGKGAMAFIGLAFVPLYIRLLGMEAYGLVGFFAMLVGALSILDMGFTTTLNRELASRLSQVNREQEMHELVRTLEVVYWIASLCIVASVFGVAPLLARYWVSAAGLPIEAIQNAIAWMGVTVAAQMLCGFYAGGLLGLQEHVACNLAQAAIALIRSGGAALVLWFYSPTITVYFMWLAGSTMFGAVLISLLLRWSLPKSLVPAKFNWAVLTAVYRFAAGLSGSAILGLLLIQTDKVLLSNMLPLKEFGIYVLAGTVATSLQYLGTPIFTAYFPVFTGHVGTKNPKELAAAYHTATQLLAIIVLPAAALLIIQADTVLLAWSLDGATVERMHILVRVFSVSAVLNQLAGIPYGLQLAHGWTRLSFVTNLVALVVLMPSLLIALRFAGPLGAALVSVALNTGYVLVNVQLMHRRLLPGEQWRWYFVDVLPIAMAVFLAGAGGRALSGSGGSRLERLVTLLVVYLFTLGVAVAFSSVARGRLLESFRIRRQAWSVAK